MADVRDLYQKVLLDHYKNPRNSRRIENATHACDGHNPLCGDRITVHLLVQNETITDAAFEASACAICTASASVMTEVLKEKSRTEVEGLWDTFRLVVNGDDTGLTPDALRGEIAAFSGVSDYPVRIKCALLPWRTMLAALGDESDPVTTE